MPSPNMNLMKAGRTYHIFNRGNNRESIFPSDEDKAYFDSKMLAALQKIAFIYTCSILDNHFHYVIKIKSRNQIYKLIASDEKLKKFVKNLPPPEKYKNKKSYIISRVLSEILRRCFIGYAMYFNKKYDRTGSVFSKSFKRKEIRDKQYLRDCIIYVNRNITNHFPEMDFRRYKWSWYSKFLHSKYIDSLKDTFFDFEGLFGDIENFIYLHTRKDDLIDTQKFVLEK
jgi:putative transposase